VSLEGCTHDSDRFPHLRDLSYTAGRNKPHSEVHEPLDRYLRRAWSPADPSKHAVKGLHADPAIDADRESPARALEGLGKRDEAVELYRKACAGANAGVAARSFAKLAEMDRNRAELYYRDAFASEEKTSGKDSPRLAVLLQEYALT
jgi:hypothetical protein